MSKHFSLKKYIFPLVAITQPGSPLKIKRFIGTGFWIDEDGLFLTCKHVIESLADDEMPAIAQPFSQRSDRFIPVTKATCHSSHDVAVGVAPKSAVEGVLPRYSGDLGLGLDVQAFGFTDAGREGRTMNLDPRLLRGYISRFSGDPFGLPSPSLIEVSFGSPCGFSGTPLLVDTEVVGMMYSNIESKLQSFSINETEEDGSTFRETAYRIYEYGTAHYLADLDDFVKQCKNN